MVTTWVAEPSFLITVKAGGVWEHPYVALFCFTIRVATATFDNACVTLAANESKRTVVIRGAA